MDGASDGNFPCARGHIRNVVPQDKFDSPNGQISIGTRPEEERETQHNNRIRPSRSSVSTHRVRKKRAVVCARETEMATPATEAATPAEGSVIAIHSLDEWSTYIESANSAKKLVPFSSFLFFLFLLPRGINLDRSGLVTVLIRFL